MESARRVAVLADVHGNAVALAAVFQEVAREDVDLVVHCGDLTWGSEPAETVALVESVDVRSVFLRGNADRMLLECVARLDEGDETLTERERWLVDAHDDRARALLATFAESIVVAVAQLGPVRFCHGSPRSDEELVTPATPDARMSELVAGIAEPTLVTAHSHIQFDRAVAGVRSVNPGSIGMPYERRPGAYWAILGPDVEHRRTEYDLDEAVARYRTSGDPAADEMIEVLVTPPTREELIAHAEARGFSG